MGLFLMQSLKGRCVAGKSVIFLGRGGAGLPRLHVMWLWQGGRSEGAGAWVTGLGGNVYWERASRRAQELPAGPAPSPRAHLSLADEDGSLCRALQPALEHQRCPLLVQGQPRPHPHVQGRGERPGQGRLLGLTPLPFHFTAGQLFSAAPWVGVLLQPLLPRAGCALGALGSSGAAG